ncbi:hypothetical protein IE53DRAFT_46652 [Violaceomyces palustris]|uniref:Uncharacterized protein n=1 Tax=Violaceomyces palustris TaxID=1673888 RepID=A0ACD0P0B8_9BASI|nr:hypothetical protein IE53DRAFT_46652 [Violaceomyces palustris]
MVPFGLGSLCIGSVPSIHRTPPLLCHSLFLVVVPIVTIRLDAPLPLYLHFATFSTLPIWTCLFPLHQPKAPFHILPLPSLSKISPIHPPHNHLLPRQDPFPFTSQIV